MLSLVQTELAKAGRDTQLQHQLDDLEQLRITPEKEIPPMQFLFQMFCKPCFPRGELVGITGKAKSGKTFVSSILMSLCFKDEVLSLRRLDPSPLHVMWFDTEQSEESTQDILRHRILPMISDTAADTPGLPPSATAFPQDSFHIFNVRSRPWQERLPLMEAAVRHFLPDLVILDGIRDLVNDINDGVMAQEVVERIMHIASDTHCCLVCILHQNKSSEDKNLRGFLGTELKNKAFEVYECVKDEGRTFTWAQTDTRKYDIIDKLRFCVDDAGIPQLFSPQAPMHQPPSAHYSLPDTRPEFNADYVLQREGKNVTLDLKRLFSDAFHPGEILQASVLQARIMNMAHITSFRFYGFRLNEAKSMGIIEQARDSKNHVIYTCPSKPAPEESLF